MPSIIKDTRVWLIPIMMMIAGLLSLPSLSHAQDDTLEENVQEGVEQVETALENAAEEVKEGVGAVAERVQTDNTEAKVDFVDLLEGHIETVNSKVGAIVFCDLSFGKLGDNIQLPLVLVMLVGGAIFFTFYMGFVNIRAFGHGIAVVRGKYDHEEDVGDVTHFQALTSALSATVGLGNISGVALAVAAGGPGAIFWMSVMGLLGMSSKFVECTLGQMYRRKNADGTISGGPMYYLEQGIREHYPSMWGIGKALAILAGFMVMAAALGGGNMFQANQSFQSVHRAAELITGNEVSKGSFAPIYGVIMLILVGAVIIGGMKRIGSATAKIVPLMAAIYFLAALVVMIKFFDQIPGAIMIILKGAFNPESAIAGGVVYVILMGVKRAAFSNEAGIGSAAIAHSAAKTKEPIREGVVALLEPFIDTVVICNLTGLVIILSGVYKDASISDGIILTSMAFESVISWFPIILSICVFFFAYSTMISWAYYGERGWIFLMDHINEGLGIKTLIIFRLIFLIFVFIGSVVPLVHVIDFSDIMLLGMAIPNIIGLVFLAPIVKKRFNIYWARLKSGEMEADLAKK